jgi:cytochrome c-type biogenesis protein CcmH/NrfG
MSEELNDIFDDANGSLALGEFEDAIAGYRKCVALDPEFFDGWQALGMALMNSKKPSAAGCKP